jgi:hypothetical protein
MQASYGTQNYAQANYQNYGLDDYDPKAGPIPAAAAGRCEFASPHMTLELYLACIGVPYDPKWR